MGRGFGAFLFLTSGDTKIMNVEQLKAQAQARLAATVQPETEMFVDPLAEKPMPIIVQKVVPKHEHAPMAKYVLESNQSAFAILVDGRKLMFTNYQFHTDDKALVDNILANYGHKVWRVQ